MARVKTVVEMLDKTTEVLATRGWYQGDFVDPEGGGVCLLGALAIAAGGHPSCYKPSAFGHKNAKVYWATRRALQGVLIDWASHAGVISSFNDDEHTTLEDVQLLCKQTRQAEGG